MQGRTAVDHATEEYFLAFDVPDSVKYFYRAANERLETEHGIHPLSARISAHLTVKAPFRTSPTDGRHLGGRLEAMVARRQIRAVAGFLDDELADFDSAVIYIPVNGEQRRQTIEMILMELQACLGVPKRPLEGARPHITVAKNLAEDRFLPAMRTLRLMEDHPTGEVRFDRLILWHREEGTWVKAHEIRLDHTNVRAA